jgi:ferredoxin
MSEQHTVTFIGRDGQRQTLMVAHGENLRRALLAAGISPYTRLTRVANCGGRGLCATCGVWVEGDAPKPEHWHDRAAEAFGYPRLSCQVRVTRDLTLKQVEKWVWGGRRPRQRASKA